jgi:hypothetical protein
VSAPSDREPLLLPARSPAGARGGRCRLSSTRRWPTRTSGVRFFPRPLASRERACNQSAHHRQLLLYLNVNVLCGSNLKRIHTTHTHTHTHRNTTHTHNSYEWPASYTHTIRTARFTYDVRAQPLSVHLSPCL